MVNNGLLPLVDMQFRLQSGLLKVIAVPVARNCALPDRDGRTIRFRILWALCTFVMNPPAVGFGVPLTTNY